VPVPAPPSSSTRRTRHRAALAGVGLLLVAGCSGEDGARFTVPYVGPADVDVDTPALREAKAAAGVEDCPRPAGEPGLGDLPELTLPCLGGGRSVDLSTLRGPMVISVWAQSCPPCREEMPVLQRFHAEHGDEVPVLGVDFQDVQVERAVDFVADSGATYPQVADVDGETRDARLVPGTFALPQLVLVDEDGRYAYRGLEIIDSPGELEDLVAEHLGVEL